MITPARQRRGYWLRMAGVLLIGLLAAAYIAQPIILANYFSHPAHTPVNGASPAGVGLAYQDIRLTASDGVSIAAWYIPPENGATIIMVHGIMGNRAQMLPMAAMLAKHGYGLLMIDMRSHGDSGGDSWSSSLAERDVLAGVDFLNERPEAERGEIGALGFSAGAQTVIYAAARSPDIGAVAADAPAWSQVRDQPIAAYSLPKLLLVPQDWVYQAAVEQVYLRGQGPPEAVIDNVGRIAPRPLLLIAGGENPNEVLFARNYLDHAGEPKELWLIPDAGHADKWVRHPQEYEAHLVAFFDSLINDR